MRLGKELIGDFVNPMRLRSETKGEGLWELYEDCVNVAAAAVDIARIFYEDLAHDAKTAVPNLLSNLQKTTGYGGSGFRAKEILMH